MSIRQHVGEVSIGLFGRITLIGVATGLVGIFVVALWLSPDPRGFGTHQQLGLPPCTFRLLSGFPCPGCGMTTSFAQFVRRDFVAAARANPAGLLLASVCLLIIPWSLISAVRGRLCLVWEPMVSGGIMILSVGAVTLIVWLIRVITICL